jgi:sulfhydrogenase subunit beta (sulfur reductase)
MHPTEDPVREPSGQAVIVDADGLPALFDALRGRGYTVVGPTVRDGAIVVAELASVAELPFGWGVETEAGRYRLRERSDTAAFGHSAGPQSWKTVLHPPRAKLWSADRVTGPAETSTVEISIVEAGEAAEPPRYALLGVRPCAGPRTRRRSGTPSRP